MVVSVLMILSMWAVVWACGEPAQKKAARQVTAKPAEVLIKFKPGAPEDSIRALTEKLGLEKVQDLGAIGVRLYRILSPRAVEQVVRDCQNSSLVEYAEPNYEYRIPEKK